MKHCVAAVAVGFTVGLAGCDDTGPAKAGDAPQGTVIPQDAPVQVSAAPVADQPAQPIAGAPEFVSLYPGAELVSPKGQGRQVTFTTDAPPEAVIAFYKDRAESSGLHPTAAMNQGGARAYGASDHAEGGHSIEVVASPAEDGTTSVQLSWNG